MQTYNVSSTEKYHISKTNKGIKLICLVFKVLTIQFYFVPTKINGAPKNFEKPVFCY